MTVPITRADLSDLCADHRLVPITRTLFADGETPSGSTASSAAGRPGTFLLESAEPGASFSRWSFVGVHAVASLSVADGVAVWDGDAARRHAARPPTRWPRSPRRGARSRALGCRACRRSPAGSSATSATTSCGASRACRSKAVDDLGLPELTMLLVTDLAAVDHHECSVVLIANAIVQPGMTKAELDAAYADAVRRLDAMQADARHRVPADRRRGLAAPPPKPATSTRRAG